MDVTITADVDKAKATVILTSDQPGLPPFHTFRVKHGDTVSWKVRGAPSGLRMQVGKMVLLDSEQRGRLFEEGTNDTLPADADTIEGTVHPTADQGEYRYDVALVGGPQPILLRCLWPTGPGQPPGPPMGGGVQTDPPPRN